MTWNLIQFFTPWSESYLLFSKIFQLIWSLSISIYQKLLETINFNNTASTISSQFDPLLGLYCLSSRKLVLRKQRYSSLQIMEVRCFCIDITLTIFYEVAVVPSSGRKVSYISEMSCQSSHLWIEVLLNGKFFNQVINLGFLASLFWI